MKAGNDDDDEDGDVNDDDDDDDMGPECVSFLEAQLGKAFDS